ncbi:DUF6695 family protein [Bacteroidota bacterium]
MTAEKKYTGFAIAIAWPETYCKQPGAWYDPITLVLGFNTNNYYRVGHAAVVLIDTDKSKCHYFDFGRYHAPFQHGRVRGEKTDHELKMETIPIISGDAILNFREILSELQHNKACHGQGELHGSYCPVDFQAAFDKANQMQQAGPIPYGPFRRRGSNCSRFVNTTIRAGNSNWKYRFRLKFMVPFTPTPMNNVNSLEHRLDMPDILNETPFCPTKRLDPKSLKSTLQAPPRDARIPDNAQWLSGEGAGSWFVFEVQNSELRVTRYSPDGIMECTGLYKNKNAHEAVPDDSFRITYPSNCKEVSFKKKETELRFERAMNN